MLCTIWYYLCHSKKLKNNDGECSFTKSPRWVFLMFLKLYKWYQIDKSIPYEFRDMFLPSGGQNKSDDGRSITRNVASLHTFTNDVS